MTHTINNMNLVRGGNALENLETNQLFRSQELGEARELIAKNISPHQIEVIGEQERLDVLFKGVCNNSISFLKIQYGADVKVGPEEIGNYYFIQTALNGAYNFRQNTNLVEISPGETMVASPDCPYHYTISGNSKRLVLGIHRDLLEKHLECLLYENLSTPLSFDTKAAAPEATALWKQYLGNMSRVIFSMNGNIRRNQMLLSYLDSTMTTALTLFRHNYSDQLDNEPTDCDFNKLSRAIDFIKGNVHRQLKLEEIARESGMSVRSLQVMFKSRLQKTPSEFLREQKLLSVKTALENAVDGVRVTDVLLNYGISSFGHFSTLYKERFGCSPSDSLLNKK